MKKRGLTVLSLICAGCIGVGAAASDLIHNIKAELREDFAIVIDGERKTFKNANGDVVYPVLYEGTTYLPIRAIGEIMGKTVYWYEDEKRIELKEGKTTVTDADVIIYDKDTQDKEKSENQNKNEKYKAEAVVKEEEAKEIALKKADVKEEDVQFIKVKLEKDDGILQYEIDFKKDKVEYSAEVSAIDGKILAWDVEDKTKYEEKVSQDSDIGIEKAKEIALEKAGLKAEDVIFTDQSPDYENGKKVYEIEFKKGGEEYSAEISAEGAIISWEVDND